MERYFDLPDISQLIKTLTNHRATYRYKPQRAILIIAFQKIS